MTSSTSRVSSRSSASFGFRHIHVKCAIPYVAARLGSKSTRRLK